MGRTFYDLLGVARDATPAEIRSAFRRAVKEWHPDRNDDPDAGDRFRAVVRAEEVLGDPDERARYDRLGHAAYARLVGLSHLEDLGGDWSEATATEPPGAGAVGADGGGGAAARTDPRSADGATGAWGSTDGAARDGTGADGAAGSATRDREGDAAGTGSATARNSASGNGARDRASEGNPTRRGYSPWVDEGRSGGVDDDGFDAWWEDVTGNGGDDAPWEDGAPAGAAAGSATAASASGTRTRHRGTTVTSGPSAGGFWQSRPDSGDDAGRSRGADVVAGRVRGRNVPQFSLTLGIVYPAMVYFSVNPALPAAANLGVAALVLLLAGAAMTEPVVALLVFGVWSVLSPLLLAFVGQPVVSIPGLGVLVAFWVPLGLALLLRAGTVVGS